MSGLSIGGHHKSAHHPTFSTASAKTGLARPLYSMSGLGVESRPSDAATATAFEAEVTTVQGHKRRYDSR